MSRIAGLHSANACALLPLLLGRLDQGAEAKMARCRLGPAGLGWTGRVAPQAAEEGDCIAVVDGRFYNRAEFVGTADDAALLIRLYRRHGFAGALDRINGDFAAALFDGATNSLWLGRDRFGIKPLYYVDQPGCFAFASRPRALLALPGISAEANRRFIALFAASHYRTFDNDPHASPYAAIRQLPAGHCLEWRNGVARISRWWDIVDNDNWCDDEFVLAERYRALLADAVGLRLAATDRAAFTLSGGMDSSSILASAVAISGTRQHAYSTIYTDKTYDESDEICAMLDGKVTQWHPVRIGDDIDVFSVVRKMVAAHDEPVATATWLSHFILCQQAAADGVGALFGGLGGDELNAGEYEYFIFNFADLRSAGREETLRHEIASWAAHHDHPVFRKDTATADLGLARLTDPAVAGRVRTDRIRLSRYYRALDPAWHALDDFLPVLDHPFRSYLKNRTYQDIFRETAPCCLRAEDRQCAAFGIAHFDPFFDHRLVEFMFRVPGDMKIRDGITKRLLREAMRGILPEETRNRVKKTGWNAPAHVWFSGRGLEQLRDLVASRAFRERGIYDLRTIDRLIAEHTAMTAPGSANDHMMFFWQLVNLETWLAMRHEIAGGCS